jgi:hypothetical protein
MEKTNAQPGQAHHDRTAKEGHRVLHEIGTEDNEQFKPKRDVLQSNSPQFNPKRRRGDIVREEVKEDTGRKKQGKQDKNMLATIPTPIRFALRSIQTTDM